MSSECILPQGQTHALYTRSISAILEVYAFQDTLISEPVAKMYSGWSFMEKCTVGGALWKLHNPAYTEV